MNTFQKFIHWSPIRHFLNRFRSRPIFTHKEVWEGFIKNGYEIYVPYETPPIISIEESIKKIGAYMKVTVHLCDVPPSAFRGDIEDIYNFLRRLKSGYENNGFTNIHLEHSEGHCYECEGPSEYFLRGDREETKEERAKRIIKAKEIKQQDAVRKAKVEKVRRDLYEQLKREFDPPKTIEDMQEDAANKRLYGK